MEPMRPVGSAEEKLDLNKKVSESGTLNAHKVTQKSKDDKKIETIRNNWGDTLKSIFMAPFRGIALATKKLGKAFYQVGTKIGLVYSSIFDSANAKLTRKSQESGTKAVKELLKENPVDVEQFKKDFERADYILNGVLIKNSDELLKEFTDQEFKNISLLMVQSLSGDISNQLNELTPEIPGNSTCPVRISYLINKNDKNIELTAKYVFAKNFTDENANKYYANFYRIERHISLSKEDLQTNWSTYPEDETTPSLKIQDRYFQDITPNKAKEIFIKADYEQFVVEGNKLKVIENENKPIKKFF